MSVSFISNILNGLEDALNDKMEGYDDYQTTPVIYNKLMAWNDTEKPCLCFFMSDAPIVFGEMFAKRGLVELPITIWGYAEADGYGSTIKAEKLLKDLLYFLWNDYDEAVETVDIKFIPGGVGEEAGMSGFVVEIKIIYGVNKTTIQ